MGAEGISVRELGRLGKRAGSGRIMVKGRMGLVEGRAMMKRKEKKEVAKIIQTVALELSFEAVVVAAELDKYGDAGGVCWWLLCIATVVVVVVAAAVFELWQLPFESNFVGLMERSFFFLP